MVKKEKFETFEDKSIDMSGVLEAVKEGFHRLSGFLSLTPMKESADDENTDQGRKVIVRLSLILSLLLFLSDAKVSVNSKPVVGDSVHVFGMLVVC